MPDTPPTLVHFGSASTACGVGGINPLTSIDPGRVTCFACRQSARFKQSLDNWAPVKLSGVMAAAPEIQALDRAALREIAKRGLNAGRGDAEWEALVEIGEALGLTHDDETNRYS